MKKKYLPYVLAVICLASRLLFFGRYVDDWDGVNFVFALLHGYDPLNDQPHFHGYPVYMFVCWVIYNIWSSEIGALILPGIIFSSLAVIPFYMLVIRMYSQRVALLASVLYIVNSQIWLQSEKTLSDAFGLFFVILFIYFFYRAVEPCPQDNDIDKHCDHKIAGDETSPIGLEKKDVPYSLWLFLGSLVLGIGIGIRISYLAFFFLWCFVCLIVCKRRPIKKVLLSGVGGLGLGIVVWLGYLVARFGLFNYIDKFQSHSKYHFVDQSYSILATTDYLHRLILILKNITAHSLGVYWFDTPLLRVFPTVVMIIAVVIYIIKEKLNMRNVFLLVSIAAYIVWIITVQTAIRHTMVLTPFITILIAAGIFHFCSSMQSANKKRKWLLPLILFFIVVPVTFDSVRLVWINKYRTPPQVAMVDYISSNYDRETTKFYCLNTWKLFQYYAPQWCDYKNSHVYFTSRISYVERNLRKIDPRPDNILISSALFERHKYKDRLRKVTSFKRDNYAVAEYNWLALFEFVPDSE